MYIQQDYVKRDGGSTDNTGITMTTDDDNSSFLSSKSWNAARYACFACFLVLIVFVLFFGYRYNKKFRRRQALREAELAANGGVDPRRRGRNNNNNENIPPTYTQSERQHNFNYLNKKITDYVPEYSKDINTNDLGYYDEKGTFHVNGNSEYLPPPELVDKEKDFYLINNSSSINSSNSNTNINNNNNNNPFDDSNIGSDIDDDIDYSFDLTRPSPIITKQFNQSKIIPDTDPLYEMRRLNNIHSFQNNNNDNDDNIIASSSNTNANSNDNNNVFQSK